MLKSIPRTKTQAEQSSICCNRGVMAQHYRRIVKVRQYASELRRLGRGTSFRTSLRVGIFGGSFNPVHAGHISISRYASRHLLLGRVLWVLAQASPNKDIFNSRATFNDRLARASQALECLHVSTNTSRHISLRNFLAIEREFNIRYTHELAECLRGAFPQTRLVFLLGADSFADFRRWKRWRSIASCFTLAVFARRGASLQARLDSTTSRVARLKHCRHASREIGESKPPRWSFVPMRSVAIASSNMRRDEYEWVQNDS